MATAERLKIRNDDPLLVYVHRPYKHYSFELVEDDQSFEFSGSEWNSRYQYFADPSNRANAYIGRRSGGNQLERFYALSLLTMYLTKRM